jgi:hypothetical protein
MAVVNSSIKYFRVRPELRSLFTKLGAATKHESAGVLVNEGLGKSIDPEKHGPALDALKKLEEAGLLEIVDRPISYDDRT